MLTCKQASQLISQSLDSPLSFSSRLQLRFHLFICTACTRFNFQINHLRSAVQRIRHNTENDNAILLSSEAKARIANDVAGAAQSNHA